MLREKILLLSSVPSVNQRGPGSRSGGMNLESDDGDEARG